MLDRHARQLLEGLRKALPRGPATLRRSAGPCRPGIRPAFTYGKRYLVNTLHAGKLASRPSMPPDDPFATLSRVRDYRRMPATILGRGGCRKTATGDSARLIRPRVRGEPRHSGQGGALESVDEIRVAFAHPPEDVIDGGSTGAHDVFRDDWHGGILRDNDGKIRL